MSDSEVTASVSQIHRTLPCNKTYFLGHDSGTWSVAQNNCRQNGGDLASIHSEEDQQAFNATRGSNTETLWIGLYWNTSTKSWKWSNGDTHQICKGTNTNCFSTQFNNEECCKTFVCYTGKWVFITHNHKFYHTCY
uniref:C-type lectin domain-containing protein n=1 Tax=Scleropages formosus TaxID=113540 RepID=A0A8C9V4E9_SCLFO